MIEFVNKQPRQSNPDNAENRPLNFRNKSFFIQTD